MIDHPAFPIDVWKVRESAYSPDVLAQSETLFALSNGYLGLRGNLDEGDPAFDRGTYLNGFFESRPITYGESAYGYAKNDQTMLNVTDAKLLRLSVDGQPLDLRRGTLLEHERVLDMRTATLTRHLVWAAPSGKRVAVRSRRFVSLDDAHLAWIDYEVEALDGAVDLVVSSAMEANESTQVKGDDPRETAALYGQVLLPRLVRDDQDRLVMVHTTQTSRLSVACGMDHVVTSDAEHTSEAGHDQSGGRVDFSVTARPGHPFRLTKFLAYHWSDSNDLDTLVGGAGNTLDQAVRTPVKTHVERHRAHIDDFWARGDVVVEGDDAVQMGVRFALFQIFQASAQLQGTSIPAKGLTGQGYEGHYFWDTEAFIVPVLVYSAPTIARRVLEFRGSILDAARARARTMNQRGALFPWRTIDGEEASAYFPAGTAQYHIDGDIAFAIRKYVDATGDTAFLREHGTEILTETARLWADLGHFSDRRNGEFCIEQVTGPDEYTALVDNNAYTNLMAAANLANAAAVVSSLRDDDPEEYRALRDRIELSDDEVDTWQRAAERMRIPFDDALGVHAQDDSFLDKERWDVAGTPPEKRPLLLHYHPMVLYRFQVLKQVDLILGMFLQGQQFTNEEKRAAFDYYDPLTTDDSSLSACIQAVMAAEVGYLDRAYEYTANTALMDIENVNRNVRDGVHIAAMAGTWIAVVHGFGGLRDHGGRLRFAPRLPERWTRLRIPLAVGDRLLTVDIGKDTTRYEIDRGADLTIEHGGEELTISAGTPAERPTLS